jgi:Holliday junction DNA helicase RuvA
MLGKIISNNSKTIVFENNYIGYVINIIRSEMFEIGKVKKVFLYKHLFLNNKNKIVEELYGFNTYEEKEFFIQLLHMTGIGVKTAMAICVLDIQLMKKLIINNDTEGLINLGISDKNANIICSEYKVSKKEIKEQSMPLLSDLISALKNLGYNKAEIEYATKTVSFNQNDLSLLISTAIKNISSKYGQ